MRIRLYSIELVLITLLAAAVAYFGYLGYGLLAPNLVLVPFSGASALLYAEQQVAYGDRTTGSKASRQLESWLVDELRAMGWDVIIQPFVVDGPVEARNIIAVRGNGPSSEPVAILSTHYDTRLFADRDPDAVNHIQSTPGANAGASGVAVLLELARTLDVPATGHTVCLAFFDAEENGGIPGWEDALGSAHFIQQLDSDIGRCRSPRFAAYLDMVGGVDQRLYAINPSEDSLKSGIWLVADDLGYAAWHASDTVDAGVNAGTRFGDAGVPVLTITGNDYPHRFTMQDSVDKLDALSLERIGRTLKLWLEQGAAF